MIDKYDYTINGFIILDIKQVYSNLGINIIKKTRGIRPHYIKNEKINY